MRAEGPRRRANLPRQRSGGGQPPGAGPPRAAAAGGGRARRLLKVGVALFALGCGLLGAMIAYAAVTLPDVNDIGKRTGTIRLLASDGKTVIAELGHDQRSVKTVPIDQIAPLLRQATVSAEDRNFYDEGAFNVPRVVKALFIDVIARHPSQGASTITQQLAKQAFFVTDKQTATKSPFRKLREALLANEIDRKYTKNQILEKYLNLIYYGENAYGIEMASQRYFGKDAAQLDLREASLLAGLPQAPSFLDPFNNPSAAYARQHYVLIRLVADGKVSQADAAAVDPLVGGPGGDPGAQQVNQTALLTDLKHGHSSTAGPAPHFAQYVQDQLQQRFGDDPAVISGNLDVTTTLNIDYQNKADASVKAGVAKLARQTTDPKLQTNNGALLMINSHTGNIEAMVGSADYTNPDISGEFDVVTAQRRPGSSFKPYDYETAFRTGKARPDSILQDTAAQSRKLGGVQDFDRSYKGPITAARSLLLSRNISTEQLADAAGIQNIIDFARSLGVDPRHDSLQQNLSTAIGSSSVRMIDHAAAYAAFSNGGEKVSSRALLRVVDRDSGRVLLDEPQPAGQGTVMAPAEAYSITKILRGYAKQWNLPFNVPTAGKSGTTDNFVDAWYMVYTPDHVVATWAGRTLSAQPGELPMDQVFGTTEGRLVAVPFVNSLGLPNKDFTPVSGSLPDCNASDASVASGINSGCPTPTPSPSASATPSPSPSPTPTDVPTAAPSLLPVVTPCPTSTPAPSGAPSPSASPTPLPRNCP